MNVSIVSNILASVLTSSAVMVFFFMWINNRFTTLKDDIKCLRDDLQRFEDAKSDWVEKQDYANIRKEDREIATAMETRIERKLDGLNRKVDEMPRQIADLLKSIMK